MVLDAVAREHLDGAVIPNKGHGHPDLGAGMREPGDVVNGEPDDLGGPLNVLNDLFEIVMTHGRFLAAERSII